MNPVTWCSSFVQSGRTPFGEVAASVCQPLQSYQADYRAQLRAQKAEQAKYHSGSRFANKRLVVKEDGESEEAEEEQERGGGALRPTLRSHREPRLQW